MQIFMWQIATMLQFEMGQLILSLSSGPILHYMYHKDTQSFIGTALAS